MSNQIAKMFSQVFGKKVTLKAQQGYGKKKVQSRKITSRKNTKKNKSR
tara:strand:+ start:357 stop:500 length:144 start_codon:yes stop_codon:yes gene_type:complete